MQLLNYYMPRLKKQFIFYPVIAVVLYLLIFVTLRWEGVIIIGAMVSNILNLMLVFGALIFASRSGMEIDTALPVDWRAESHVHPALHVYRGTAAYRSADGSLLSLHKAVDGD